MGFGIGFLLFWAFHASAPFAFHSNIFLINPSHPVLFPFLSLPLFLTRSLSTSVLPFVQCRDCGKQVYLGKFFSHLVHTWRSLRINRLSDAAVFSILESLLTTMSVTTCLQVDLTLLMRLLGKISTNS